MLRHLIPLAILTGVAAEKAQECSWNDVDGVQKPLADLIAKHKMRKYPPGPIWCPTSEKLMCKPDDGSELIPLYWIPCKNGQVLAVDTKANTGPRTMPPGRFDGCRKL